MTVVPIGLYLSQAGLSRVLLTLISYRYGQRCGESHRQKGLGMKKELLTVKELAAELRMSVKSVQRAYRSGEIPVQWLRRMARRRFAQAVTIL